ncbi:MAG: sugar phosphate nucleotidyltransferase [Candidatus Babeliaceae bacterium]|jgi:mannose-1-phosphate guanylyltransferase
MENKSHSYGILLAGGGGYRLWPLSRKNNPKYFLPLNNQTSLLEATLQRMALLIDKDKQVIVTTKDQVANIKKYLPISLHSILHQDFIEPRARNTAAAVLLATLRIYTTDPDALLFFAPVDHDIPDEQLFCEHMHKALNYAAEHNTLVLLGITPSYPATGYGYIQKEDATTYTTTAYAVKKFYEKPLYADACLYINQGMLWNSGIFCAPAAVIIEHYKNYAQDMLCAMQDYILTNDPEKYYTLQSISFDHLILEKCPAYVIPAQCAWSDMGTFATLLDHTHYQQPAITIDGDNNKAFAPGKLVTFLGVENIWVIETHDAILVMKNSDTENVKKIASKLTECGYEQYV